MQPSAKGLAGWIAASPVRKECFHFRVAETTLRAATHREADPEPRAPRERSS